MHSFLILSIVLSTFLVNVLSFRSNEANIPNCKKMWNDPEDKIGNASSGVETQTITSRASPPLEPASLMSLTQTADAQCLGRSNFNRSVYNNKSRCTSSFQIPNKSKNRISNAILIRNISLASNSTSTCCESMTEKDANRLKIKKIK